MKNRLSVTAVQRDLRRRFNIHQNQAVPICNTIIRWIHAIRKRDTLMNSRSVERVRQSLLRSQYHFARRHATERNLDILKV